MRRAPAASGGGGGRHEAYRPCWNWRDFFLEPFGHGLKARSRKYIHAVVVCLLTSAGGRRAHLVLTQSLAHSLTRSLALYARSKHLGHYALDLNI